MLYLEKESFRSNAYSSYNWDTIYNAHDIISIVPSLDITHFEKESFTKRVNDQIIIEIQFIYLYFSRYIIWIVDVIIFWKRIVFDQYYFELKLFRTFFTRNLTSDYPLGICEIYAGGDNNREIRQLRNIV